MPPAAILIEDSQIIRENLIPTLKELANIDVIAIAETELEAVEILRATGSIWDLAIVDMFLKSGSGLGVLQACRARRPNQYVIVLSNYATASIREKCIALGADAVFDKSTEIDAFFSYFLNSFGPDSSPGVNREAR